MAVTIVSTVGAADANSYCTLQFAIDYHEERLHTEDWDGLGSEDKKRALIMATATLDDNVVWEGARTDDIQALRHPRFGLEDQDGWLIDSDIVDISVQQATAELAKILGATDTTATPETQGIEALAIAGGGSIKFDKHDRDKVGAIPESVARIIEHLGSVKQRGGSMMVKLEPR